MDWKRFPVPEFDCSALKGLTFEPPDPISQTQALATAAQAASTDASLAGGYVVEPDTALLERLNFSGEHAVIVLCALPGSGAHLLARSRAWFNQQAFILDGNTVDAQILHDWRTPRTFNNRFGPDDGLELSCTSIWILTGRVTADHTHANRVMIDTGWIPDNNRKGFRVIAAGDTEQGRFHDSCFELAWAV